MTEQDLLQLIKQTLKILNSTIENLSHVTTEIAEKFHTTSVSDYKLTFSQKGKDRAEKK